MAHHRAFVRHYETPFYKDLEPNVIFNNEYLFVRFYPVSEGQPGAIRMTGNWSSRYVLDITVKPAFGSYPPLVILQKSLAEAEDEIDISTISKVVYRQTSLNDFCGGTLWKDMASLATLMRSTIFFPPQSNTNNTSNNNADETQGCVHLSLLYAGEGTTLEIDHGPPGSGQSYGSLTIPLDEFSDSQQMDRWFPYIMPYLDALHITPVRDPDQCHRLSLTMQLLQRITAFVEHDRFRVLSPLGILDFAYNSDVPKDDLDDLIIYASQTSLVRQLMVC